MTNIYNSAVRSIVVFCDFKQKYYIQRVFLIKKCAFYCQSVNVEGVEIAVTISIGLAEYNREETGEELFEYADKALYEAKKNGRNQVQVNL